MPLKNCLNESTRIVDRKSVRKIDRKLYDKQIKTFQNTPLKPPTKTTEIVYKTPRATVIALVLEWKLLGSVDRPSKGV